MFYAPSYLTGLVDKILHDATFRAMNPGAARSIRVASLEQLAHLDPDLDALTGDDAELAARELARAEYALFWSGLHRGVQIEIQDGAFPTALRDNIIARARLQAHRNFGASHAFVKFVSSDPRPLWEILNRPPFVSSWAPSTPSPWRGFRRDRTPRWIR